jgi:hypothetical protein
MKKAKVTKVLSSIRPIDYLAAGFKVVEYSSGTLLLQKGADLRLFHLTSYQEGGAAGHGQVLVSFMGKVP